MLREGEFLNGAAKVETALRDDCQAVGERLFAEVLAAIEGTHAQIIDVGRQGGFAEQCTTIESEITYTLYHGGDYNISKVLALVERGSRYLGYAVGDDYRLDFLVISECTGSD